MYIIHYDTLSRGPSPPSHGLVSARCGGVVVVVVVPVVLIVLVTSTTTRTGYRYSWGIQFRGGTIDTRHRCTGPCFLHHLHGMVPNDTACA